MAADLLASVASMPNVITLNHGASDTTVIVIGTIAGLGYVSPSLERYTTQQVSSLILAARPLTLVVEACAERVPAALLRSPAAVAAALDSGAQRVQAPFLAAIYDATAPMRDAVARQYRLRHDAEQQQSASASVSASASASSSSDSSSSFSSLFAEFGLPDRIDLDSLPVEKLIQMASSMLQSASNEAADAHDVVLALPKYRAPPADVDGAKSSFLPDEIGGSSSSALASMLSVASSSSSSSSPSSALSALLAGAPPASSTAPPATRIVLGARPLSTTIARLERRDLLQLLLRGMRAVVRSALEPFLRARQALVQSTEALHGEDWLLSLLPFPVDTPTLAAVRPYLKKLWWRETLSSAELTELRARVLDLEWVRQPSRALFDLSFLARWVEALNALVPSVLVEEDRYLAAQIAAACEASARRPPVVGDAPRPARIVVAVVNVFRLPGIRTHWAAACAGAIDLVELDGRPQASSSADAAAAEVAAAAAFDLGQSGLSHGKPSLASASARSDIRVAGRMFDLSASAASSSSSSTVIFERRVPWWVRPAATTAAVVCGVYATRWLLRALLPRVISAALYPTLSLVTTGTFAVGGAKLRTYADACWHEAMENPHDKLIDASHPESAAAAAAPGALVASQNQSQNQSSAGSMQANQANQPHQPQRAITGAQIDARVAHTARSVGGMLLAGSAAWVGIHIVADQSLSSSSSENGATRLATTLATLLSAGFCAYGCVEYARAGVRLERKAARIAKNVRANLTL